MPDSTSLVSISPNMRSYHSLRTRFLPHFQLPIPLLQPLQHSLPLLRQLRLAQGVDTALEEPRAPFHAFLPPYFRLFSLLFFDLLLDSRGFGELFREDGGCDARPETQRFVFQLQWVRRGYLWMDGEGNEVDEESLVLGVLWCVSGGVGGGIGRGLTIGLDPTEK
jgi:hypothetical protein